MNYTWLLPLTQCITGGVLVGAEIKASQQNGVVMLSSIGPHQHRLPGTEAVQSVVCMVSYGQTRLRKKTEELKYTQL